MKAYILYLGDMYSDSNINIFGSTSATVAEPNAPHKLLHTPSYGVLVNHPDAGWILYDTCMCDDPKGGWPQNVLNCVVVEKPEESKIEHQLGLVGITPKDIQHVIISHMHMDHIGNDSYFAETANFYVSKEDAAHSFRMVLQSPNPATHGFLIKEDVLLARKSLSYIDRDEELFPGVEVITLPGHTPCVLGLVLHLKGGTLIFPSDAIAIQNNYDGQMPGYIYDSMSYQASIRKVKDLQKKYNARVFCSHDANHLSEMKKAPEFYD